MSGTVRAEQDVAWAVSDLLAELRQPTERDSGGFGLTTQDSRRLIDALVRTVEARCAEKLRAEAQPGSAMYRAWLDCAALIHPDTQEQP